jgi:hypothetical protein
MSLLISSVYTYDADVSAYILAVEAADGQTLEPATRSAINKFVVGCKADSIWTAIKASCILSGARTLAGALVPLVGAAPTNINFVSADYDRKTGLKGDAATKRLHNFNTYVGANPSRHAYVYCTEATTGANYNTILASQSDEGELLKNGSTTAFIMRPWGGAVGTTLSLTNGIGGLGIARQNAIQGVGFTTTAGASTFTSAATNSSTGLFVYARSAAGQEPTNPRIAFFSGGQFLGLPLLDARVTTLINAFAVTIP